MTTPAFGIGQAAGRPGKFGLDRLQRVPARLARSRQALLQLPRVFDAIAKDVGLQSLDVRESVDQLEYRAVGKPGASSDQPFRQCMPTFASATAGFPSGPSL